ncbi:hypothetical protein GF420_15745 [candidate division GN15 bacterium]|nr:hypothetical protein [candidate division GN15 bacterium]
MDYQVKLSTMICYVLDLQLPHFSPYYKALYFPVDLDLSYYTDEESFSVRAQGEFLFRRANNATNVWFRCPVLRDMEKLEGWDNISNHTSCWRDAVNTALYKFRGVHEEKLKEQCDPDRISEHVYLWKKCSFRYVDFELQQSEKRSRKDLVLTEIKPWKEEYTDLHPWNQDQ